MAMFSLWAWKLFYIYVAAVTNIFFINFPTKYITGSKNGNKDMSVCNIHSGINIPFLYK